jgi:hypothetical protein
MTLETLDIHLHDGSFALGEGSYTLNKLCTGEPLSKGLINVPLVRDCTLELWLECITTGPEKKYTPLPIIHDLYTNFCRGKGAPTYDYKPFKEKLEKFLELRRNNMGPRPIEVVRQSAGFAIRGFRPSYIRMLALEEQFYLLPWTLKKIDTTLREVNGVTKEFNTFHCEAPYATELQFIDVELLIAPPPLRKSFEVTVEIESSANKYFIIQNPQTKTVPDFSSQTLVPVGRVSFPSLRG